VSKTLLLIPHYNDAERVEPFLNDLLETLPSHFAILVSDDGSLLQQRSRLEALISEFPECQDRPTLLSPLFTDINQGKGSVVRRGWAQAENYSLIAFADADGAVSAKEILRAERYMRQQGVGADALFASRVKMLGRSVKRSGLRHYAGRIFATLVSVTADLPAYDTQCGLKIIKTEHYKKISPYLKTAGFSFDVELCMFLMKSGSRIIEFPVDWQDIAGSKVNLLRDSIRMALEVFKIRHRVSMISTL
jgi:glycosyltransferase involved in cell wall biosynthesis